MRKQRSLHEALAELYRRFGAKKKQGKIPPRQAFYAVVETRPGEHNYRVRLSDANGRPPRRGVGTVALHCRYELEVGAVYGRTCNLVMSPSAVLAEMRAAADAQDTGDGQGAGASAARVALPPALPADGDGPTDKCMDCAHATHAGPCEEADCSCGEARSASPAPAEEGEHATALGADAGVAPTPSAPTREEVDAGTT